MPRVLKATAAKATLASCALMLASSNAGAQSIEPRSYSNAPVGVNFLLAGYAQTTGSLEFGPSLPVTNAKLKTSGELLAFARTLDFWGKSGKFDIIVPYSSLSGTADYAGKQLQREVDGLIDPLARLSVNLYGAPALSLKEFRDYRQDLIVGTSLQVSAPLGQYDNTKIVNLGANRWTFKPEIGVSKAIGSWTMEGKMSASFFTDNKDFYGGSTRSQAAIYSTQGHVIYSFDHGIWASLDATYFTGGRTELNGVRADDLQKNWRFGGTLAVPIDASNSIKFFASSGVSARTGNNFDLLGVLWQYRWGSGL